MKEKQRPMGIWAKRMRMWGILLGAVCLFSGCGKKETVFLAGDSAEGNAKEEQPLSEEARESGEGSPAGAAVGTEASQSPAQGSNGQSPGDSASQPEEASEELVVYVCGQVKEPGVYALQAGARVADAIEMAGGMTEEAARDALNLAQTIGDAQMIRVPSLEEAEEMGAGYVWPEASAGQGAEGSGGSGTGAGGQISLNRATREELMTLPGIGVSKADAILSYRQENGPFKSIEEIMNITGIKEGVFLKIKDQITI